MKRNYSPRFKIANMERIIFEGTEQQIQLLKDMFDMLIIEHGEQNLPSLQEGFYTGNLWSVHDVQHNYKCTNEQALEVLSDALTNEVMIDQIQFSIREFAEIMGLEEE